LAKRHKIQVKKETAEEVMETIKAHGIYDDMPVATPMARQAPVELIAVVENGFCCEICDYCCPTQRTFNNHWSKEHKNAQLKSKNRYHQSDIQTFFDPVPLKYFEVSSCLKNVPVGSPYDLYIRNELPKRQAFTPSIPVKDREVPPLLQVTQWHNHLAGYITNDVRRAAIRDLVKLPKGLQQSGLHNVVLRYMDWVSKKASELPYQLRCLLIECPRCVLFNIQKSAN
jgi:hypothetical protein